MKKKILVTGLTGLVGSRFVELLGDAYDFKVINRTNGVDILDKAAVLNVISSSEAQIVLHMAGKTNVDGCELDKARDKEILEIKDSKEQEKAWRDEQTAWAVNVFGTQNIVKACQEANKKIVYISTDFVFDGKKRTYSENDHPSPVNWYAKTKYEGEKFIQSSGLDYIIARLAYPYRAYFARNDFVRALIVRLERSEKLSMVTDHIMVPTFIDDIVNALDVLINLDQVGIFHVVGSQTVTPYEAAIKIAQTFDFDESLISETSRREYFAGKAPRPFCLHLKNDKIGKLGIEMSTFDKGIAEVKAQMEKFQI
ncbi:MAG TPA: SDR family oxidoreductase [Patescibacteria group bacterium]|jgi:dTDP-4-dehydrorhamnose reductase|nr:SDR family oxidoreductase [Patescibacteria group bacterium]